MTTTGTTQSACEALARRGVTVRCPASVDIDASIDPDRIAPGVTLHAGCRLSGADTSIGPGCVLGEEGPLTLTDCQLGHGVRLRGGACAGATFLDGVDIGSCAHVRPGTLIEESASCGHAVGLKQTLLMPHVTLGSLINFCDCLMAGGTGPNEHSEVGSSYVHFNFTAHQDKATASLFGDVPHGVLLDRPPIFLGGQGGTVGPCRVAYGTIVAAGTICRHDVMDEGRLVFGQTGRRLTERPYDAVVYGDLDRVLSNNFRYIANLHALDAWYRHVRLALLDGDPWRTAAHAGARRQLDRMARERAKQLARLAERVTLSLNAAHIRTVGTLPSKPFALQARFVERQPDLAARLLLPANPPPPPPAAADAIARLADAEAPYLARLAALHPDHRLVLATWLQSIVDAHVRLWSAALDIQA